MKASTEPLSNSVFELAEKFMKDPKYVFIQNEVVEKLAEDMKTSGKIKYALHHPETSVYKDILSEIISNSINYCFWYGCSYVRPNGSSSALLYDLVHKSLVSYPNVSLHNCLNTLCDELTYHRFPLLEQRIKHLKQLKRNTKAENLAWIIEDGKSSVNNILYELISRFPGYASDLFLKRAVLLIVQLFRRYNWFSQELRTLHIPADYQVPKILNCLYCTKYSIDLQNKIISHTLIPQGSLEECEIRSATILIAKKLCELTGWNVAEIDTWLFLKKDLIETPFHLTITTDY